MKKYDSILIKNIDYLITMDKKRRILRKASIYIKGQEIKDVASKVTKADKIIDASGMVVLPGLINTHHHLFQTLFRGIDKLKKQSIIPWVQTMSQLVENLDYQAVYTATLTGLAELLLSGCTTTSDFLYTYPNKQNNLFDATVRAAEKIGVRFHLVRGYMERLDGDVFPSFITQKKEEILSESERVIDQYHNPKNFSMCQVALGPCDYYSTSKELFRLICGLARKRKVRLHTHFAESPLENGNCQRKFNQNKTSFFKSVGCFGKDVWLAHVVYVTPDDIDILAKTKTNVAHCPICNMAKKQPAPIIQMAQRGVNIGIGVDGSASNDSSNMLIESRIAGRLQGLNANIEGASYLRATDILEMATLGGARCLGREKEVGSLEVGKAADIIMINIANKIECAGAYNPLEAIFHTGINRVDYNIINGKVIVDRGKISSINLTGLIQKHNKTAKRITGEFESRTKQSLLLPWKKFLKS